MEKYKRNKSNVDSILEIYNKAKSAFLNGRFQEAINLYNDYFNKGKENGEKYAISYKDLFMIAKSYVAIGRIDIGTRCYESILKFKPDDHRSLFELGKLYFRSSSFP